MKRNAVDGVAHILSSMTLEGERQPALSLGLVSGRVKVSNRSAPLSASYGVSGLVSGARHSGDLMLDGRRDGLSKGNSPKTIRFSSQRIHEAQRVSISGNITHPQYKYDKTCIFHVHWRLRLDSEGLQCGLSCRLSPQPWPGRTHP